MIIIYPDGHYEEKPYVDYKSIAAAVNLPGGDDPFTMVPLPEGNAAGYTLYVNDNGLLSNVMQENRGAEFLASYGPLVGPACLCTFAEAKEEDCLCYVTELGKENFETRLNALLKIMKANMAKGMN